MKKSLLILLIMIVMLALTLGSCKKPDSDGTTDTEQIPGGTQEDNTENGGNTENGDDNGSIVGCEHTYGDWVVQKTATCKDEGIMSRACSKCGDEELTTLPTNDAHVEVIDEAVEPTCTTTGLTEGKHCEVCGKVILAQTELAKTSHSYADDYDPDCNKCGFVRDVACGHFSIDILPAKAASCIENGLTEGKVCSSCEEILQPQQIISALGHTEVIDAAKAATCTEVGLTEGKHCSACGDVLVAQENVAPLGHTSGDWIVESEATATTNGYKYKACIKCGVKTDEKIIIGLPYSVNADGTTCTITGKGSFSGNELEIPEYIDGYKVTTIGDYAFSNCRSLTSVTIGDSVTTIGEYAFDYCIGLTSVTIPDSVTTIGKSAFDSCISLTSVTIGDSVTTIGWGAFYDCSSLTSVTIPDSVTTIGEKAFYGCDSLTSVTIPDSVTTIGDYAFLNCTSLTSVTIPDSVITISKCAFYGCDSLTSVTIGDSVTTIGGSAFSGCTSLTDVYYTGSEAEWAEISIDGGNDYLINANITYNYVPAE